MYEKHCEELVWRIYARKDRKLLEKIDILMDRVKLLELKNIMLQKEALYANYATELLQLDNEELEPYGCRTNFKNEWIPTEPKIKSYVVLEKVV